MATKYVTKDAWHFQYILSDTQPFYTALVTNQGAISSDFPHTEIDDSIKTIFPGSDQLGYTPIY